MRIAEKKIQQHKLHLAEPYSGRASVTIVSKVTGKEFFSDEFVAKNGEINIIFPAFRAEEYDMIIQWDWFSEIQELSVVSIEEIQKEKNQSDFRDNNKEKVVGVVDEILWSNVEPKIGSIKEMIAKQNEMIYESSSKAEEKIEHVNKTFLEKAQSIINGIGETFSAIDEVWNKKIAAVEENQNKKINETSQLLSEFSKWSDTIKKSLSELQETTNELKKAIPEGWILEYEVDDEKTTKENLWSAAGTMEKIKKFAWGFGWGGWTAALAIRWYIIWNLSDQTDLQAALDAKWNVFKVGTPVAGQIGIWTADWFIEGNDEFRYDASANTVWFGAAGTPFNRVKTPDSTWSNAWWGMVFQSWAGGASGWNGGAVAFQAWASTVATWWGFSMTAWGWVTWGNLILTAGTGSGWTHGSFVLRQRWGLYNFRSADSLSTIEWILNFSWITTSDKTFTFPNTTGNVVIDANANTFTATQTFANVATQNIEPVTDDTYYLGKNDDDTPKAWKWVILKDTADGKYYRIEVTNGVVTATDLTD